MYDKQNTLLDAEIQYRGDIGVLKLPEVVVNGVVLRGNTNGGSTMELNVAEAICNGFTAAPQTCSDIYARKTVAPTGNAKVTFNLEMKALSGSALQVSEVTSSLQNRLASTIALKLGVDPLQVVIAEIGGEADKVVVNVVVNNLVCAPEEVPADGKSPSEEISDLLKGTSVCAARADTSAEVDDEVLATKIFTFHSGISNGQTFARQIQATVMALAHDDSMCQTGGDSGVGVGTVILIVACLLSAFGIVLFIYYRRSQQQLRREVQNIMDRYMPLDDGDNFGDAEVGNDDVRLINGGETSTAQ